jgi:hypothetical protein
LGPFGLGIIVVIVLYLQNVVALAYIGTDNQFVPKNDEFNSDDENVIEIEGESKQATKLAKIKAKKQRSTMNLVNAFCEAVLEDPQLWRLPTSNIFQKTVTAISASVLKMRFASTCRMSQACRTSSSRVRIKGNENEGNYLPSFFYKSNVVIVIRIALGFCL